MAVARNQPRLPKASDILADQLRAEILRNHLKSGDDLPSEAELIALHQFSRSTVREALRLLESDGLITIQRGSKGGIKVARPDMTQVSRILAITFTFDEVTLGQFLAFRQLIEGEVAALAAENATPEQRKTLLEISLEETEKRELGRAVEFHGYLGECTNNGVFKVIIGAIHEVVNMQTALERLTAVDTEAIKRAHRKIAQAINAGKGNEAKRAMISHLARYEEILEEHGRLNDAVVPPSTWSF